jgi:archaellum biogenesis ATPase FlaH
MVSSGMLHHVAFVRNEVSEELKAYFIRVTRIGELGTTLAVTSNRRTLRRNTKVYLRSVSRLFLLISSVASYS